MPFSETMDRLLGLLALLTQGGPVVFILLLMSVLALTVTLAKLWHLRYLGAADTRRALVGLEHYRRGLTSKALESLEGAPGPVSIMVWHAIGKRRSAAREAIVREEIERVGQMTLAQFRSWLRVLEVIAALAPLLGLLGTVLGMIEAFRQMELAGNQVSAAMLSGGIWEALLTTAMGLAVAIPTVAAFNWLERRVERSAESMDDLATRVFTGDIPTAGPEGMGDGGEIAKPAWLR